PWANTRRPTGERQVHGLTGQVLPAPPVVAEPARHVVELPPGAAEGTDTDERGTGTTRRAPSAPPIVSKPAAPRNAAARPAAAPAPTIQRAPAIAKSARGGRSGPANRPAEPIQV